VRALLDGLLNQTVQWSLGHQAVPSSATPASAMPGTSLCSLSEKRAIVDAHDCFVFDCDGW
jgi:hypothetical protein